MNCLVTFLGSQEISSLSKPLSERDIAFVIQRKQETTTLYYNNKIL